jgi:hypothetical protein
MIYFIALFGLTKILFLLLTLLATGFTGIYPDFLFMMSMDKERCWRMMKVFLASGGNSMTRGISSADHHFLLLQRYHKRLS